MNKDFAKRTLSLILVITIAGGIFYFMFRSVARDWPTIGYIVYWTIANARWPCPIAGWYCRKCWPSNFIAVPGTW